MLNSLAASNRQDEGRNKGRNKLQKRRDEIKFKAEIRKQREMTVVQTDGGQRE
jgi:hypothetical protein